jgi:hypothetical protein
MPPFGPIKRKDLLRYLDVLSYYHDRRAEIEQEMAENTEEY